MTERAKHCTGSIPCNNQSGTESCLRAQLPAADDILYRQNKARARCVADKQPPAALLTLNEL